MNNEARTPEDGRRKKRTVKKQSTNPAQRKKKRLPTVDEILHKLLELTGAVAMGAISTKDANLIHKNLKTVLDVQLKRSSGEMAIRDEAALTEVCRQDPAMLNVLEPFLTDEQFNSLMRQATGEADE